MLGRHRFKILLATLAVLIATSPLIGEAMDRNPNSLAGMLTLVFMVAILLSAINAVSTRRRDWMIAAVLFAPSILLQITYPLWDWFVGEVVQHTSTTTGLLFTAVVMIRYLFEIRRVTFDLIAASLCVYLLLAVLWSDLYVFLVFFEPEAFIRNNAPPEAHWTPSVSLYYSLVTISTLGYGDIVPRTEFARMLSAIEAVAGQLFLAVFVARLVGIHISRSLRDDE